MKNALLVGLLACLAALPARAEFSLGVKAGTLGIGVEGTYTLNEKWSLRGGLNTFEYSFDDDVDDVTYDGDLDLSSVALLGDFRPTAGGFRITGGAIINNNEIVAVADPVPTYELGENVYTLAEVGELSADVTFDDVAPYLGIGYDFGAESNWRFGFDLGVLFQGDPEPGINSTGGTLSNDPGLRADLDAEEDSFVDDLDGFDIYPVVSLGVQYAFR
ncbi:MAG: hypothetical protein AAGA44_17080 [Pseudomonadota bacterium]